MATNRPRAKKVPELSCEQLIRSDILIRQTHEKLQVIFLVLKNLQVEVQELRNENRELTKQVGFVLNALRLTLELPREDQHIAGQISKDMQEQLSHVTRNAKPL